MRQEGLLERLSEALILILIRSFHDKQQTADHKKNGSDKVQDATSDKAIATEGCLGRRKRKPVEESADNVDGRPKREDDRGAPGYVPPCEDGEHPAYAFQHLACR